VTAKQNAFSATLAALDGARIAGGCDHCDAYQTVHANYWGPNAHRLSIHHDDWCPFLASLEATP
jgi:hypothetical protein